MKRLATLLAIALVAFVTSLAPAFAVNPDEMLSNPVMEKRARAISAQLRCLVCQNESIDVSDADLAKDLRLLVRRRLEKGETNKQVIAYIVSRYGEFVLLKPRFETRTVLLWATPLIVFLCGAGAMALHARSRRGRPSTERLSEEEEARLRMVLDEPNRNA